MADITQSNVDHGKPFDFGKTSDAYAKYRDIYPESFYAKLFALGIGLPGQHILDLGTGTGVLPRAMAPSGAHFTGIDISPEQIAQARALSQGMEIDYLVSPAEEIDFAPGTFDAITAVQCFWYFNRAVLLPKLHEMLKEHGQLAILNMAWLPHKSKIARQSEQIILKYNPAWTGKGMRKLPFLPKPRWAGPLFRVSHRVLYCEGLSFTRESWHGRMLACRGIGASSLPPEQIAAFEREHLAFLATLPEEFTVPHQIVMLILQKN